MIEIPIQQFPAFDEEVELDGTPYLLSFSWNTRDEAWYMDISTIEGEAIIRGIRLVVNYELIGKYADPLLPPGEMVALDTEKSPGQKITQDGLGERFKLLYVTEDDIDAL